jgi:hypothetical protein
VAVAWLPTIDSVLALLHFVQLLAGAGRYHFRKTNAPRTAVAVVALADKVSQSQWCAVHTHTHIQTHTQARTDTYTPVYVVITAHR